MKTVARELAEYLSSTTIESGHLVLIHGGGSYGHYYAKKFGLSTKRSTELNPKGVAKTCSAMLELHSMLLEQLTEEGVFCGTVMTSEMFSDNASQISSGAADRIRSLFTCKLVPISFGNVQIWKRGVEIISGDQIALALANSFDVDRVIFAMDVDGIYPTHAMDTQILSRIEPTSKIAMSQGGYDVTGGIAVKIKTGFQLARKSADVFYLNGAKAHRLSAVLKGDYRVPLTRIYSNSAVAGGT
jgi:isopentenyl phosphate kinase